MTTVPSWPSCPFPSRSSASSPPAAAAAPKNSAKVATAPKSPYSSSPHSCSLLVLASAWPSTSPPRGPSPTRPGTNPKRASTASTLSSRLSLCTRTPSRGLTADSTCPTGPWHPAITRACASASTGRRAAWQVAEAVSSLATARRRVV